MTAGIVWRFDYIKPGEKVSFYKPGYSDRQAVNYSAVVYSGGPPGGFGPFTGPWVYWVSLGHVALTQGETFRHWDRTIARKVHVQNLNTFTSCSVDVLQMVESI